MSTSGSLNFVLKLTLDYSQNDCYDTLELSFLREEPTMKEKSKGNDGKKHRKKKDKTKAAPTLKNQTGNPGLGF